MCIKDRKRLKRFGLALLGLCLYLFDTGSDTWVGYRLIQNCHVRYGAGALCLVYVVPGLFTMIAYMIDPSNPDDGCISNFFKWLILLVFLVPVTAFMLLANLVKMTDESLKNAKK